MSASVWLPEGHLRSWGLEVLTKRPSAGAGPFTGGGWKINWHTTEGGGMSSVIRTVQEKGAVPHVVLDPLNGRLTQLLPFDTAARALAHPTGPETNRANVIQVELIGFSSVSSVPKGKSTSRAVSKWGRDEYRRLAALSILIEHRHPVPRHAAPFRRPVRMGGAEFVRFAGHVGHCHVPNNDHYDPGTGFNWPLLLEEMNKREPQRA